MAAATYEDLELANTIFRPLGLKAYRPTGLVPRDMFGWMDVQDSHGNEVGVGLGAGGATEESVWTALMAALPTPDKLNPFNVVVPEARLRKAGTKFRFGPETTAEGLSRLGVWVYTEVLYLPNAPAEMAFICPMGPENHEIRLTILSEVSVLLEVEETSGRVIQYDICVGIFLVDSRRILKEAAI